MCQMKLVKWTTANPLLLLKVRVKRKPRSLHNNYSCHFSDSLDNITLILAASGLGACVIVALVEISQLKSEVTGLSCQPFKKSE